MTIFGWDASDYDWGRGAMDLVAARRAGIDFFTHKSTEGTGTKHAHYGEAMRRARDAGVPFLAAYHVVRSPRNPAAEVDYCLAYVDAQTPWWRDFPGWWWQVDLETWPYDAVPADEGENFADIIEARTGRRAVIYASRGQYGDRLAGTSHPLWNANYGSNPRQAFRSAYGSRGGDAGSGWVRYSGVMPAIWQYGSQTTIGTQPTCDANAFRGTVADFAKLINMSGPVVAPAHREDDDVKTLIRYTDDPQVFLTDGVTARLIGTEAELRDVKTLADEGLLNVRFPSGEGTQEISGVRVRVVGRRELIGRIVGPVPAGYENLAAFPQAANTAEGS